ncbi:MAG TPA: nucleoside-triphosphatase [Elusimicrobiota bacterium]|nr:nucleoside-triphosphatase [Elusimicrobiota bacterium]
MIRFKSFSKWSFVCLLAGLSLGPWVGLAGIAALSAILLNVGRFRENRSAKFYLSVSIISFLPYALIRRADILHLSLLLFFRSLTFYNTLLYLGENMDFARFHRYLSRGIGRQFSLSLSMALNLLPWMRRNTLESHALFVLRQRRPKRFLGYVSFIKTILRQTIHTADQMAENLIMDGQSRGPALFIITGERQSGKTTLAANRAAEFLSRGWAVSGILAPGTIENGRRMTIRVRNIRSGEDRLLASRNGDVADVCDDYGGFRFSKTGLDFSLQALRETTPDDIVFVDEIGPLELQGKGHAPALRALLGRPPAALYLVVRLSLVESVVKYFRIENHTLIHIPELSKESSPS